ncbi:MAG: FadR family transcriptional regulator [Gammaproteobacteria bacterium]|nr:FadR family transcriptional regulator [Gammaproteobacteria bacterium]NIR82658.1 FadR family transcriptional regulator [Gammaproteobacteria bacterium]NIR89365.1 FadR family transcriptional regulator [Gammaproteobacteria bacterium]NIU03806.1 FadR family transcriptional regulator [Gammaproteobacteria bacterium]NIV51140.1 FCD domain-containing protein [Gammaproteobacteria bacterium]
MSDLAPLRAKGHAASLAANKDDSPHARKSTTPPAAAAGSAGIVSQLRRAILDGTYGYNERLPPERELASHFEASRGTVREALRQLEEMRLVTRRVGSGTFVSHRQFDAQEDIAEVTSPLELIEVRLALEPHMARLAVINANARNLERMRESLQRVENAADPEGFSRADEEFHMVLAECTGNPLIVWLYRHINDVRAHAQWNAMKDQILTPERILEYNTQHRQLYTAVARRDVEAAVNTIKEHIEKAHRDLLGVRAT